jgi:hypothetical protein
MIAAPTSPKKTKRVRSRSSLRTILTLGLKDLGWNVGTVGLAVGILSVIVTIYVARLQKEVQGSVAAVQTSVQHLAPVRDLSILRPRAGDAVGEHEVVEGITRLADRNIYVVVTPAINGISWVQDGPVSLNSNGLWSAPARFGESENGINQAFSFYCIATKEKLPAGRLSRVPADALISDTITVTRRR